MARPRTPTALLEARGAFTRHPERKRERAHEHADGRDLGPPPDGLEEAQQICWEELVKMAAPGVLTGADRGLVEATARLWAELRQTTEEVVTKDGAVLVVRKSVKSGDVTAFVRCLGLMGLSPADRSKVNVPKPKLAPSGFDALQ